MECRNACTVCTKQLKSNSRRRLFNYGWTLRPRNLSRSWTVGFQWTPRLYHHRERKGIIPTYNQWPLSGGRTIGLHAHNGLGGGRRKWWVGAKAKPDNPNRSSVKQDGSNDTTGFQPTIVSLLNGSRHQRNVTQATFVERGGPLHCAYPKHTCRPWWILLKGNFIFARTLWMYTIGIAKLLCLHGRQFHLKGVVSDVVLLIVSMLILKLIHVLDIFLYS